jgi:hypothetical protein
MPIGFGATEINAGRSSSGRFSTEKTRWSFSSVTDHKPASTTHTATATIELRNHNRVLFRAGASRRSVPMDSIALLLYLRLIRHNKQFGRSSAMRRGSICLLELGASLVFDSSLTPLLQPVYCSPMTGTIQFEPRLGRINGSARFRPVQSNSDPFRPKNKM